jgi:hypothetical protein
MDIGRKYGTRMHFYCDGGKDQLEPMIERMGGTPMLKQFRLRRKLAEDELKPEAKSSQLQ